MQRGRLFFGLGLLLIATGLTLSYVAFLSPAGLQARRALRGGAQGHGVGDGKDTWGATPTHNPAFPSPGDQGSIIGPPSDVVELGAEGPDGSAGRAVEGGVAGGQEAPRSGELPPDVSQDIGGQPPSVAQGLAVGNIEDTLKNSPPDLGTPLPLVSATSRELPGGTQVPGEEAEDGASRAPLPEVPSTQPLELGEAVPEGANDGTTNAAPGDCDLFTGTWVPDPKGALYTRDSCDMISRHQDCRGNGRPDSGYENYRWRPAGGCRLPRFDAREFFRLMAHKTIAFVGDSVARNQMESLLCLLNEVEAPKQRGNKSVIRYSFQGHHLMLLRIWSSWLVNETYGPWPQRRIKGFADLHLGEAGSWVRHVAGSDVVVLSSGHWFVKPAAYYDAAGRLVGAVFWPKGEAPPPAELDSAAAFRAALETALRALAAEPGYRGLTVFRTWSPDHYAGGAWDSNGSCAAFGAPLAPGATWRTPFGAAIWRHQVEAVAAARRRRAPNGSRLALMDVTPSFEVRADGHPGPYRGRNASAAPVGGRPPPQDCLHWCMPGPVDTWNEFLLEMIRRDFEGKGVGR